jgi:O-antigen/teichoic acid export membrane protein
VPLQILIASLPFLFINFALSYFLNATDRQRTNTFNLGLVMILNVVLNVLLIPQWSTLGASLASTISTISLFCLNLSAVYKVTQIKLGNWWPMFKALLASLLMALVVIILAKIFNIWLCIAIGFLVYFGFLILFKNLEKEDYFYIRRALKKN